MRYILFYITLLLSSSFIFSNELVIGSSTLRNYPEKLIEFYYFDSNFNFLNDLSENNIRLEVDESEITNYSLTKPNKIVSSPLSVVLSVDISDLNNDNLETIKNNIRLLEKYIPNGDINIAVHAYNSESYILQNLTMDYSQIIRAINIAASFGVTNFNTGFLKLNTGSIDLLSKVDANKVIINFTQGNGFADSNSIINTANSNGVRIYNYIFNNYIPKNLKTISNKTNGRIFKYQESKRLLSDLIYIINKESGIEPFRINYMLHDCRLSNLINMTVNNSNNDRYTAIYKEEDLPYLEIYPSSINFGIVEEENIKFDAFSLVARNANINLLDIQFDSNQYSILPDYKNILLTQNSPKIFQIELNSVSTDYNYSDLRFITDACYPVKINLLNGKIDGNSTSTPLEVIFPNGDEVFYPGQSIDLTWDGVIDTQKVIIDYSYDNGLSWNLINESASLKTLNWEVPNLSSDDMLLRVSLPNGNLKYENIKYVFDKDVNKKIKHSSLSFNDRFAGIAFEDGSIFIWDLDSNRIKSQLRDKNLDILTSDIEFSKNSSLFAAAFGKNNEHNVVYWDAENTSLTSSKSFEKKPVDIDWSKNGISLFIGFEDGELIEWNTATDNTSNLLNLNSIEKIAECNSIDLIAIASNNKIILTDFEGNKLDSISVSSDILDLDWNPSGNKLSVVYDFSDLRIFRAEIQSGVYNLLQEPRINRSNLPHLTKAEWVSNNSIMLSSKANNLVEYWNTNGNLIFDFDIHKSEIKSLSSWNNKVLSSTDSNTALVWNVDDFPFNFSTIDKDSSDNKWSIGPIQILKRDIDLGELCIDNAYSYEFIDSYVNTSNLNLEIDSIISSNDAIQLMVNYPLVIDKGLPLKLEFTYTPLSEGLIENKLFLFRGTRVDTISVISENTKPSFKIFNKELFFDNIISNTIVDKSFDILLNDDIQGLDIENIELIFGGDVFEINSSNSTIVSPKEKLVLDIKMKPIKSGTFSGLIKLSSSNICNPIYITLLGKVSNSNIQFNNFIELGQLYCDDTKDTSIVIKNFSTNSIKLLSQTIIDDPNNAFNIVSNLQDSIGSGDSLEIKIELDRSKFGLFNSKLNLRTNLLNIDSILIIELNAIRDSINLEFLVEELDYGTISLNTKSTKQIRVVNKSLLDYSFTLPNEYDSFSVISALPGTISINDTALVEIEFTGSSKDSLIQISFPFDSSCSSSLFLPIMVNISNGKPVLSHKDTIDLGTVNCNDELVYNITLTNTGKSNLIIDSIAIEDINNEFSFGNDDKNISISPDDSELFDLVYTPNFVGKKTILITIYSNSDNSKSTILVKLNQNNTELKFNNSFLVFDGLRSNNKYSKQLEVENIGNTVITPSFINDPNFIIDSIVPINILPNESAMVYITFLGGEKDSTYIGILEILDECDNSYRINLEANVGGDDYVTIKPEDIIAKTGELINLNIIFNNTTFVNLIANDTIQTKLVLNSSILSPLNEKHKGVINNFGDRVIDLKIPLVDNPIIYQIPMIVTLGDTSYSEIKLVESTHLNDNFYINDFGSGSITVTNIVTKPTDRYIDGKGKAYLSNTSPSPIKDIAKIKYGVIESAIVTISLYDINGKEIEELVNRYHVPGEYELEINPQNLSSGNYLYKLETPSMEIIKKMTIIR